MAHESAKVRTEVQRADALASPRVFALRTFVLRAFADLRAFVVLILLAYFALGILYAANTPAWQAPDEPAHYNYVRYLAEIGALPVLHFGDYPHGYLEQIKTAQFPPELSIEPIRYESHQPPLYYALLAPVYSATGGSLFALRLVSVLLGAGIVALAYAVARRVVPGRPAIALAAAAFVAFLPQHLATVSQVGNDVLAELLYAGVLYILVALLRPPHDTAIRPPHLEGAVDVRRALLLLGVLLGLIAITKTTAYIAAPLAGGVLLWRWAKDGLARRTRAPRVLGELALVVVPAALIALPWLARNAAVYGWPDVFGLIRHDQIVQGQTRTAAFIAEQGAGVYAQRALEFTFKSFWGVFGWLSAFMDSRIYLALALFSGAVVAGFESRLRSGGPPASGGPQGSAGRGASTGPAVLLALSALLTLLTYIYYNVTFVQHQGRYLFTALIPVALVVALGWEGALRPHPARTIAAGLVILALGLAVGGAMQGAGLPKWPLAITGAFAAAFAAASVLPAGWRRAAYAVPFALLPLISLYALFGVIGRML